MSDTSLTQINHTKKLDFRKIVYSTINYLSNIALDVKPTISTVTGFCDGNY